MPPSSKNDQPTSPTRFSLRRRVQLCIALLALESYISFEEIYMLPVLQRVDVPVLLVSLPGTISSAIGVFVIPLLGWASDRLTCGTKYCGQKRPFAIWTLAVTVTGVLLLVYVSSVSLYNHSDSDPVDTATTPTTNSSSFIDGLITTVDATTPMDVFTGTVTTSREPEDIIQDQQYFTNITSPDPNPLFLSSMTTADPLSLHPIGNQSSYNSSLRTDSTESPGNVSDSQPSSDTIYMSTMGILGIAGFVLSDHGYDSSMSSFKAYMIAVTPSSQHDGIFVLGTLAGAIGGCITSLLGFVDLSSVFADSGAVLDKGIAQCLVQALILLATLLLFSSVSLLTGSENQARISTDAVSKSPDSENCVDECGNAKTDAQKLPLTSNSNNAFGYNETTPLVVDSFTDDPDSCFGRLSSVLRRWKRQILLCVMTFLGLSANYAYFVYVTNYVAEVIYEGEPTAETGSQAYESYVEGVHIASLGMLTFYCLFVVYNVFHNKILATIGMRNEYLSASVGCAVLMLTLAFTNNIIVFFVNAATMAVFRSAVYTVPFILSNNYAKEEMQEGGENSAHSSGVAMATISAMIPASYFLVSLIMGPLMDVTGYPGTPIFFAAGVCILGIVSALFVTFE